LALRPHPDPADLGTLDTAMTIRRVVPNIASERLEESRGFYTDVVGLQVAMDMPIDRGRIVTLVSPSNPTAQISLLSKPASTSRHPVPTLTIEVADVDAVHARAVAAGVRIVHPLTVEPWGVRRFFLADPNGIVINVMSQNA
jgi:catechol 2,3-dioxygenase-like lactoylglutathione lyase family enzyme